LGPSFKKAITYYFIPYLSGSTLALTPIKEVLNVIKQNIKAADDLFSTSVSRIGAYIEVLFNWLIKKQNGKLAM